MRHAIAMREPYDEALVSLNHPKAGVPRAIDYLGPSPRDGERYLTTISQREPATLWILKAQRN